MNSKKRLSKAGIRLWARLFTATLTLTAICGCGGVSTEVKEAQEAQIQQMYEEATTNPPNLSPAAAQRRKQRVEMDFGITPDDEDEQPK